MKEKQQTLNYFYNELVGKDQLKNILGNIFSNYGLGKSIKGVDKIKNLTFHYATQSGISLSIEDLHVPFKKGKLVKKALNDIASIDKLCIEGKISDVERFQKNINI